ncbi:phage tail-collar fiber domain-containing protein [Desulfoluna spongiiphila]|uniref:phage tail-collar fiber domain-containing protein n=1 Tax=Desulfoluna spongiiphila TaxID=419481 RepID=UPI001252E179|nr:phage tail protein [Desulfoluna spongiiphila]VVS90705.1 phage tail fibre protein [Desulfoluna spongiiphila]
MSDFYTLWTDAGLQQIGASIAQDKKFTMPTAVVGDGGGNPVIPTKGMTCLTNLVWEGSISSITQSRTDENTFVYEFAVPSDAGPFTVREVGLKDETGTLCIVGNFPDTQKPVVANGSLRDMIIRIPVHIENADSVSLNVDPLVVASNGDVDRKIAVHNEHGEAHLDIWDDISDKTAQATEDKRGTAAIATQDEVDAGESAVKVVVPAKLKAWWESVRTWGNIKNKPIAFPPATHNHPELLPVGIPLPWPTNTPPDGWVIMQGQKFNTQLHPNLALAYPSGILPDMRGQMVKGKAFDREILSKEDGAVKSHTHDGSVASTDVGTKYTAYAGNHSHSQKGGDSGSYWGPNVQARGAQNVTMSNIHAAGNHRHTIAVGSHVHNLSINDTGNEENTVKNIAFNWIVRLA